MGRSDLTQICILLDQVNYRLGSAWWKFLLCTHLEIRLSFMTSLKFKRDEIRRRGREEKTVYWKSGYVNFFADE